VPAAGSGGPKVDPQTRTGRSNPARRIGFIILCAALILGLIAVFVVLPRWQEGRQRRSVDIVAILTTEASPPPTTPPIENTVPPTMTVTPRTTLHEVIEPSLEPLAPTPTRGPSEAERDFRGTMSEGLQALESGRWEEARSALERADRLKPGAPEVADALARVAAGLRRDTISASIQRALELERDEEWHEAEEVYRAVLAMDPEAAQALAGHDRASYRADLDEKLEYHLRNPGRLTSPAVLEDASALLEEVRGVIPSGPRITDQSDRLEHLIETASTPIPVILESDNLTEVTVFRVGRLGVFSRRELNLRPGSYTAVGSRAGFRDTRVRFVVAPGSSPKPVVIRCTDGI